MMKENLIVDTFQSKGKNFYISSRQNMLSGWKIIQVIPEERLFEEVDQKIKWNSIFLLGALILVVSFSIYYTKKIIEPLEEFCKKISHTKGDQLQIINLEHMKLTREIANVIENYNEMANKMNEYLVREIIYDKNQRKIQSKMLRYQINPHFLYNTLNLIASMGELSDFPEIVEITKNLSCIMQYNVKGKAKVKDILTYATENKFGVAAINTLNIETVKYVIEAAERERVPIIVQFYPGFSDYTDLKHLAFAACDMAEKASIPVGVHLDHSVTYEIAVGGIRDGFPSVMIDGSTKSFQENVELTKNVVRVAKVFGVDVEAELGHVGNGDSIDAIDNTNYYTKVEDAVRFVEQTGCDSLAIAVGNAHGPYVKTPNLDLERIYAIRKKVNIPLVLHGCSDIPEEQMKEAVNLGMSKFNIATEYFRTMYQSIEKRINNQEFEGNGVKLMYDIKEEMIDFVIQKIRLLNPNKYSM